MSNPATDDFEPLPIYEMTYEEMARVHSTIAGALRLAGLNGPALDHAIAATYREALRHIEAHRHHDRERREAIHVVGGVDA